MSNELLVLDDTAQAIANIKSREDVEEFLRQMHQLKDVLEALEQFEMYARKYITLEVMAYVHIVNNGWEDQVPRGTERDIAKWLADLPIEEREQVINTCVDEGMTLCGYYTVVVKGPEREERAMKSMERKGNKAIEQFKRDGIVALDDVMKLTGTEEQLIPYDIRKGYKDQVRDRIRKLGGHGLGDDNGTYITKEKAEESLDQICINKIESIALDIGRLSSVLDKSHTIPQRVVEISRTNNQEMYLDSVSIANILMCLMNLARPQWIASSFKHKLDLVLYVLCQLGLSPSWLYDALGEMSEYDMKRYDDIAEAHNVQVSDGNESNR